MTCPVGGEHDFSQWQEFIEESPHCYVESISIYNDYLVMIQKIAKVL